MDDIRIGISQPRNKNLAEIFHRLRLIESYGTGIRRIYKLYENCDSKGIGHFTGRCPLRYGFTLRFSFLRLDGEQ